MKSNVMKRAWEIRREAAKKYGHNVMTISFSICLRQAWEESKSMKNNKFKAIEDQDIHELKERASIIKGQLYRKFNDNLPEEVRAHVRTLRVSKDKEFHIGWIRKSIEMMKG